MKWILLLVISLTSCRLFAQPSASNAPVFSKHIIPMRDSTGIYVNDGDSTTLYYNSCIPKGLIRGALVLFPPNGQSLADVIAINTRLISIGQDSGILTIIPSVNNNLYLDRFTLGFINAVLREVMSRYKIASDKFVLGGFSLGGMNAIRYTELAYESGGLTAVKPAAVYGIDPPLDWARIYYSFARAIQKNFSAPAVNEAEYFIERLNEEFGGRPEDHSDTYMRHSMYSRTSAGGGNAKYLRTVPVRIYSDPDIDWQLANKRVDYYDMNVLDAAAMINQLHLDGNNRQSLSMRLAKDTGPMDRGIRTPGAWPRLRTVWAGYFDASICELQNGLIY
jgi:pimeloyl-ACP methyl ester carboxylesterase